MKKFICLYIGAFLFILSTLAIIQVTLSPSPKPPPLAVDVQVLDPSLEGYAAAWRTEVSRRFPDAVVLLMHGGNFVGDQWICTAKSFAMYTTVPEVIAYEQAKFPGRTIVVLACNPGHIHLHGFPNVYIAYDSVYCVPDRAVGDNPENALELLDSGYDPALSRWSADPNVYGNIYEFQEAR